MGQERNASNPDNGLDRVCATLEALYDAGEKDALLTSVHHLLSQASAQVDQLGVRVAQLLKQLYGRRSERINPNQLMLALAALSPIGEPDAPAVPVPPSEGEPRLRQNDEKAKKRGRKALPAHLPREEVRLVPTAEQLAETAGGMSKVGEQRSEVLEYEPARFKVLVYVRETWSNAFGEIVTAPVPDKVIDKGLAGPGLLTQVVVSKYRDHVPLARQTTIYQRSGVELSRNTLVDWVAAVAFYLQPLARLIYQRVMASHIVQADDTRLPVQDRHKDKNIKNARMWALVGDHDYVAYHYAKDWKGSTTAGFLGDRIGWLQVDGYAGYDQIFAAGLATEVGCWMHCRRYFIKAFDGGDKRAAEPVGMIRQMYRIEAESKEAGDSFDQRLERRLRETKPIIDQLGEWIVAHAGREPPSTPLGKAFAYARNQWSALARPLEDGALELDNGDAERALRGTAMGRKNWLFAGSDEGAERAAIIATVLESATRHGLDIWQYLHDLLIKLGSGWRNRDLEELLPHRWRDLYARPPGADPPERDNADS